jgi:arginyl-tRNA synthetase
VLERPRNAITVTEPAASPAKIAKRRVADPYELAREIAEELASADGIASVQVAGPGFINIRVEAGPRALCESRSSRRRRYGRNDAEAAPINLEFVSANPTCASAHTAGALATPSAGCCSSRRHARRASSTSTMPACRWTASGLQCGRDKGRVHARGGYRGEYRRSSPSSRARARPDILTCRRRALVATA